MKRQCCGCLSCGLLVMIKALLVLLSLFQCPTVNASASLACNSTLICATKIWPGSECIDGQCSNPFQSGCLRAMFDNNDEENNDDNYYNRIPRGSNDLVRICNSEDPPDAIGVVCAPRDPHFEYMEIRIMSQNWASAIMISWILQILLSEMLGIPTTIESSSQDAYLNFYDPMNAFAYGKSNYWDALYEALNVDGDCTKANNNHQLSRDNQYKPCAHLIPEVWGNGYQHYIRSMTEGLIIDTPAGMGAIGQLDWFVPKFVVDKYPFIVHWGTLTNRAKMAELFLRPTSWFEYCTEVSDSNCTQPDNIAQRAPQNDAEKHQYFAGTDLFIGHFRKTEQNDCQKFPQTCTGHIADFPCEWQSHLRQQTYHNNIALQSDGPLEESSGYSYSQLVEIWTAANATKSNVIMYWWTPDDFYQKFLGTEAEFTRILLPPPTQDCIEARISRRERCPCTVAPYENGADDAETYVQTTAELCTNNTTDITLQKGQKTLKLNNINYGSPEGSCDDEPQILQRLVASIVEKKTYEVNDVQRSPAYDVIKSFSISELQIAKLLDHWQAGQVGVTGIDLRKAVCQWTVDNLDQLQAFIPRTYPRTIQPQKVHQRPLFYVALIAGGLSTISVVLSALYTYTNRKRRVLRYAQVEFMLILLLGMLMVSIGSISAAVEPSNFTCIMVCWLVTLGYTLEIIPLIVKVAAMNKLMNAANRCKRVRLKRKNLFATVFFFAFTVVIFLSIWTVFDTPHASSQLHLTDKQPNDVSTVVNKYSYCASGNIAIWRYISVGWHCVLLLLAVVLAFQTRNLRQGFNESQILVVLMYSQFFFVVLQLIVFGLENSKAAAATSLPHTLEAYRSLIHSMDTIMTTIIYFVPKFVARDDDLNSGLWFGKNIKKGVEKMKTNWLRSSRFSANGIAHRNSNRNGDIVGSQSNTKIAANTSNIFPRSDISSPENGSLSFYDGNTIIHLSDRESHRWKENSSLSSLRKSSGPFNEKGEHFQASQDTSSSTRRPSSIFSTFAMSIRNIVTSVDDLSESSGEPFDDDDNDLDSMDNDNDDNFENGRNFWGPIPDETLEHSDNNTHAIDNINNHNDNDDNIHMQQQHYNSHIMTDSSSNGCHRRRPGRDVKTNQKEQSQQKPWPSSLWCEHCGRGDQGNSESESLTDHSNESLKRKESLRSSLYNQSSKPLTDSSSSEPFSLPQLKPQYSSSTSNQIRKFSF